MVDRREFLRLGAGTALGLAASPALAQADRAHSPLPGPGPHRPEGFGYLVRIGEQYPTPRWCATRCERGINYFDTAESYRWGSAEEAIGEALKGKRNEVLSASKTKAGADDTRADMMKALEGSLKRLQTDHVDMYFNHAVNDVARMQNPEWCGVHRARKDAGQDPLPRHVRPRQPPDRVPRLCHRPRPRRRDPGGLQLRPGPELLRQAAPHLSLGGDPAGPAAGAGEGQEEGRRRDRDEDADGRAPERHASLRAAGRDVFASGVPLGAVRAAAWMRCWFR